MSSLNRLTSDNMPLIVAGYFLQIASGSTTPDCYSARSVFAAGFMRVAFIPTALSAYSSNIRLISWFLTSFKTFLSIENYLWCF